MKWLAVIISISLVASGCKWSGFPAEEQRLVEGYILAIEATELPYSVIAVDIAFSKKAIDNNPPCTTLKPGLRVVGFKFVESNPVVGSVKCHTYETYRVGDQTCLLHIRDDSGVVPFLTTDYDPKTDAALKLVTERKSRLLSLNASCSRD
jgi:hypothetical protein